MATLTRDSLSEEIIKAIKNSVSRRNIETFGSHKAPIEKNRLLYDRKTHTLQIGTCGRRGRMIDYDNFEPRFVFNLSQGKLENIVRDVYIKFAFQAGLKDIKLPLGIKYIKGAKLTPTEEEWVRTNKIDLSIDLSGLDDDFKPVNLNEVLNKLESKEDKEEHMEEVERDLESLELDLNEQDGDEDSVEVLEFDALLDQVKASSPSFYLMASTEFAHCSNNLNGMLPYPNSRALETLMNYITDPNNDAGECVGIVVTMVKELPNIEGVVLHIDPKISYPLYTALVGLEKKVSIYSLNVDATSLSLLFKGDNFDKLNALSEIE